LVKSDGVFWKYYTEAWKEEIRSRMGERIGSGHSVSDVYFDQREALFAPDRYADHAA
jgi:hypothetical protein